MNREDKNVGWASSIILAIPGYIMLFIALQHVSVIELLWIGFAVFLIKPLADDLTNTVRGKKKQ